MPKPFIITGQDDVLTYIHSSLQIKRQDMNTAHEEADAIIQKQVQNSMDDGYRNVKVICDYTDVLILMCSYWPDLTSLGT